MGNNKSPVPLPEDVWLAVSDEYRRAKLRALGTIDTAADPDFDRLTRLASHLMDTPIALVTLLDVDRQSFKSAVGIAERGTPIEQSFCAHAIAAGSGPFIVEDATADQRFAGNPLVVGE